LEKQIITLYFQLNCTIFAVIHQYIRRIWACYMPESTISPLVIMMPVYIDFAGNYYLSEYACSDFPEIYIFLCFPFTMTSEAFMLRVRQSIISLRGFFD